MTAQAKVGAFFIVAIALLGYLTIMVGDVSMPGISNGPTVRARFPRVDGLEVGDTVTVAGIPSGEVRRMAYADGQVEVELDLHPGIKIPADSRATIAMDGLLSGKVLTIEPGRSDVLLADGETLESIDAQGIEEAIQALGKIGGMADKIETFIDDLDGTRQTLEDKIVQISDKFVGIADKIDGLIDPLTEVAEGLRNGEGTIGKLLQDDTAFDNIDQTLSNLSDITDEIRRGEGSLGQLIYGSETVDSLNAALDPLKEVLAKVNDGQGTLGKAVNDPELYNNLNEAFGELAGAISDVKVTMANMREITDKVNKGEGTLGGLVNDRETLDQLKDTMSDVGEAAETLTDTQSLSVFLSILGLAF
jgi:phospholipid/cholesterol/gamma-HCH transport system substrate-binding protein